MSPIKNVAVVGATGNLGPAIVKELLAAGFNVTALQRADSTSALPQGVASKKVDYSSVDSLREALAGQDAVVSTIASPAVGAQTLLIDAALAAGVKRFIPSEFGINTRAVAGTPIGKILAAKVSTVDCLSKKAEENPAFTWNAISNGYFFDLGLKVGWLGLKADSKTATIYDSGNERFQASNLSYIGKAVAASLQQPEKTANRFLKLASFQPTQNEILAIAEELTGGAKWAVTKVATSDLRKQGEESLAGGNFGAAFFPLLATWLFRDGEGHPLKEGENVADLLGLPKDDLRETVRSWLSEAGAI